MNLRKELYKEFKEEFSYDGRYTIDKVLEIFEKRIDEMIIEQQKYLDNPKASTAGWYEASGAKYILGKVKELLKK